MALMSTTSKRGGVPPPPRPLPPPPRADPNQGSVKMDDASASGWPPAKTRPPTIKKTAPQKDQHCRFYNFNTGTCRLPDCCYWHVGEDNWDYHRDELVPEGDKRYVTPESVSRMKEVHEAGRRQARQKKNEPSAGVAKPKSPVPERAPVEEVPKMSNVLLQKWLDAARNEKLKDHSIFLRDRTTLAHSGHEAKVRFPLEEATWTNPEGHTTAITMYKKLHVTWCCMLYGSGKGVMKHLKSCLLLGHVLRYQLKPLLRAYYNIEMENVLFVTETSLDEDAFRSCSFMWSMQFKNLPTVHESRVAGTSSHLIGEGTDAAHVFLKCEAFKMPAELSIISDLDIVITSVEC